MTHAAIKVDIKTSMPNDAQTRMTIRRIRSLLADAQRSMALKMPVILMSPRRTRNKPLFRIPILSWEKTSVRVFCYTPASDL